MFWSYKLSNHVVFSFADEADAPLGATFGVSGRRIQKQQTVTSLSFSELGSPIQSPYSRILRTHILLIAQLPFRF